MHRYPTKSGDGIHHHHSPLEDHQVTVTVPLCTRIIRKEKVILNLPCERRQNMTGFICERTVGK